MLKKLALVSVALIASAFAQTKVVMLGTGTPRADPDRFGPSVAVVVNESAYIVDAGPGIVRRAAAAFQAGTKALQVQNLHTLFLTHLHSDHTVGYPDFLLTPAVLHRMGPVRVYGPKGTQEMTDHLYAAWKKDIDVRVNGLEHEEASRYHAEVHEIKPGVVLTEEKVKVTAFPVKHGSWDESFGYRFEGAGRSIVISGDTAPTQAVVEACHGCDVLIHEVYCESGFKKLPADDQKYHSSFHTSAIQLGRLASEAKPKLLVLYHQLFFGCTDEELVKEVKSVYNGQVRSAKDLEMY